MKGIIQRVQDQDSDLPNSDIVSKEIGKVLDAVGKIPKFDPNDIVLITNIDGEIVYITQQEIDDKIYIIKDNKIIKNVG